jgi:hypothetical protein
VPSPFLKPYHASLEVNVQYPAWPHHKLLTKTTATQEYYQANMSNINVLLQIPVQIFLNYTHHLQVDIMDQGHHK